MQLEKIVTFANRRTKIQFLAMERSLRAVGCQLPIWVIPYDSNKFELPKGSIWWEVPEIIQWLDNEKVFGMMRKYQCLTTQNYQYVDTDICFLRNPEEVLSAATGFVTSCGHWHNPNETQNAYSKSVLMSTSTTWQQNVFNAGQFACDQVLYDVHKLKEIASSAAFVETCVRSWSDQPAFNLLVSASGVIVSNLTLPPTRMESTWAGDYPGDYEPYWTQPNQKPYLIHWAGNQILVPRPINTIFYQYLTDEERIEWDQEMKEKAAHEKKSRKSIRARLRHIKQILVLLSK
jgi:hypothetical protein